MPDVPFELYELFLFTVPGFMTVWAFCLATRSPKPESFEYFAFSVWWGLVLFAATQSAVGIQKFQQIVGSPLSACLVLSLFGAFTGGLIGLIVRDWGQILKDALVHLRRK